MNKHAHNVRRRASDAWQATVHGLQQMSQASSVRPQSGFEVFTLDVSVPDDQVKLDFGPIVFNVPERPNKGSANLYVVAKGWLTLEGPNFKELPLRTKNFGTEVGYFRQKGQSLEHVYGAHFDMDESRPGHPIFHVQFGSQHESVAAVREFFKCNGEVVDRVGGVLGNVRTPTAQMDIFAVVAQVCADHLIWQDSGKDVKDAFAKLRKSSNFFVGAAHRLSFLNQAVASGCYRSFHWYEAPAANA